MEEKYLKLLDKQIDKLSDKDFDLDAWKSSASYLLNMILGPEDLKIKEIDKLKIDYSSWALRDSSSTYKPVETCKKMGKEIMEMAKDELDLVGASNIKYKLDEKLKELLSQSQFEKFIKSSSTAKERKDLLKSMTKDKLIELISEAY